MKIKNLFFTGLAGLAITPVGRKHNAGSSSGDSALDNRKICISRPAEKYDDAAYVKIGLSAAPISIVQSPEPEKPDGDQWRWIL
jgi:hypothetical protein